jgi:hypothetical protein
MSLVLNGGAGGSGTTQFSYLDSRIVSALPSVFSFWFKTGINDGTGGRSAQFVQSDATLGTYLMGSGLSRSVGPVFNCSTQVRPTTATVYSFGTRTDLDGGRYAYPISAVTTGATTTISVDTLGDAMPYVAGMYVKPEGTFSGVSGLVSGREYRVASVSGANAVLEVATTGALTEGWAGTVRWSAWQPERWNLGVIRISNTADPARLMYYGGFVGAPGVTISKGNSGQVNPSTIFDVMDRICFGGTYQSGAGANQFRGELAHLAVWEGVTLDDSKAGELLTVAPNLVSWGTPLAYVPCLGDGNATVGATNLTTIGDPTYTSDGPSITLSGGGGGSGTFIPSIMRAQPTNLFGF